MSSCVEPPVVSAERTFTRLYAAHFEQVYRLIGRYGVAPADVEDLTQQVFGVALAQQAVLAELKHPRAWLAAIAVRIVHDHYRWRRVRRLRAWLVEHSWAGRAHDDSNPEQDFLHDETAVRVRRLLGKLSAKLRDALVLVELEGLDPREAAAILGVPPNTLRSRQRLARAELTRLWREGERESEPEHA